MPNKLLAARCHAFALCRIGQQMTQRNAQGFALWLHNQARAMLGHFWQEAAGGQTAIAQEIGAIIERMHL